MDCMKNQSKFNLPKFGEMKGTFKLMIDRYWNYECDTLIKIKGNFLKWLYNKIASK